MQILWEEKSDCVRGKFEGGRPGNVIAESLDWTVNMESKLCIGSLVVKLKDVWWENIILQS